MPILPENVKKAWEDKDGALILTTVAADGTPNSIYATCVSLYGDDKIVIANNYFDKTMKNITAGSSATVLFITREPKAYQVKGSVEYFTEGPVFDDMKKWNPEKHPGHGAAAVTVEEVYSGGTKIL